MVMYRHQGEKWREIRMDMKERKKASRCTNCNSMKDGWCNAHKTWCNEAYLCKTRFPGGVR